MTQSDAPGTKTPFLVRLGLAVGGALLLLTVFRYWGYDYNVSPPNPLTGWELYSRTDLFLAATALLAGVAARSDLRPLHLIAAVAGALACVVTLRVNLSASYPATKVAFVAAAVVLVTAAIAALAPERRVALASAAGRSMHPLAGAAAAAWPRVVRVLGSSVTLGVLIGYVTFPLKTLVPAGGTDASWMVALNLAAERGMAFGSDVIFTYGPLGFLAVPRDVGGGTAGLGMVYWAIVIMCLATSLVWAARKTFPLPVAVAVALISCMSLYESIPGAVVAIVLVWAVAVVRNPRIARSRWWWAILASGGALAASQAMIKLNGGITIAVLCAIAAFLGAQRGLRLVSLAAFAASFALSLALIWLAIGQAFADLGPYLHNSLDVVLGFAEYQYTEAGDRLWEYYGAACVMLIMGFVTAQAARDLPAPRLIGVWLLSAAFVFAWWKQGFVRHDGHSTEFFLALMLGAVALAPRWPNRATPYIVFAALLFAWFSSAKPVPWEWNRQAEGYKILREQISTLRDGHATFTETNRGELRAAEELDDESLALLQGRTVHFFPTETAMAFAYPELDWKPAPVFQHYQAYTENLDRINAEALTGPEAPERLLRTTEYSGFENPTAVRAVFCGYRELRHTDRWQVLTRASNRCGPLQSMGRVKVQNGEGIAVPEPGPDDAVLIAIHGSEPDLRERIRSFLWKPYDRSVQLDDARYRRFAVQLADVPSLLRVGSDVDFEEGFRMDDGGVKKIAIGITSEGALAMGRQQPRPLEVEFFRMPVTSPAVVEQP